VAEAVSERLETRLEKSECPLKLAGGKKQLETVGGFKIRILTGNKKVKKREYNEGRRKSVVEFELG